jgi:hypothetical protein
LLVLGNHFRVVIPALPARQALVHRGCKPKAESNPKTRQGFAALTAGKG